MSDGPAASTLVIGLGNPGGEYAHTRHNMGWWCLEVLERRGRFGRERREGPARVRRGVIADAEVVLARPQTYMNLSGRAGKHLTDKLHLRPEDGVIVIHDDLDLPLGRVRLKRGGGHAGQKGVLSLIGSWRTQDFVRVRIGIGRPVAGLDPADHVLEPFAPGERGIAEEAVGRAADAVVAVISLGEEEAMNRVNRRAPAVP